MTTLIYCFLMALAAAAMFVKFYEIYELQTLIKPTGRTVLAVTVTSGAPAPPTGWATSLRALVVFAVNAQDSPALEELQEIASDISQLSNETGVFDSEAINQFANFIRDDDHIKSGRQQVPDEIARGHELFVASIDLDRGLLHPTWNQHGVVVVSKTGKQKGRVSQLPWNHKESQKLFSGVASPA